MFDLKGRTFRLRAAAAFMRSDPLQSLEYLEKIRDLRPLKDIEQAMYACCFLWINAVDKSSTEIEKLLKRLNKLDKKSIYLYNYFMFLKAEIDDDFENSEYFRNIVKGLPAPRPLARLFPVD